MNGALIIGIIGAGKVGSTLARLWHQKGYRIAAIYSRGAADAAALAQQVGAEAVTSPDAVVRESMLTLLTVPDDALTDVAGHLHDAGHLADAVHLAGKAVVHTSGAHNADVLHDLEIDGAMVGSLHPAFPFADVATSMAGIAGAAFAVEAETDLLRQWLVELVQAIGGQPLAIGRGDKVLYHAALVLASNYTVTLYAVAERLLRGIGAAQSLADAALNPLVSATVANLREHGVPAALTGPLARGDAGTVERHLRALQQVDPSLAEVYRQLARLSFPMLEERRVHMNELVRVLEQDETNANHDS